MVEHLKDRDYIPIGFPLDLGRTLRIKVAGSAHYRTLTQFVTLAVGEKLEREFSTGGKTKSENKDTFPSSRKKTEFSSPE